MSTSTELITIDAAAISDEHFPITREEIQAEIAEFESLACDGIDDKEGLEAVRNARLRCKKVRTAIETRRKELKRGALEYGRRVDATAKELTSFVEPTEQRLKAIEDNIAEQIAELKRQQLQARMDQLAAVRASVPAAFVETMTDDSFAEFLTVKTEENQRRLEQERLAAEEKARQEEEAKAAREAEEKRLAAEREEIALEKERIAKEAAERQRLEDERLAAERAKLEAERQKLAEQKRQQEEQQLALEAEQKRQEEERQRRENEERERVAAEQRRQREAEDSERKAREEAAERERLLAQRPDRQKLLSVADVVLLVEVPAVSEGANHVRDEVVRILHDCVDDIRTIVDQAIPEVNA